MGGGGGAGSSVNQTSVNVYKNLIEKERKQWNEERQRKQQQMDEATSKVKMQGEQIASLQEQ